MTTGGDGTIDVPLVEQMLAANPADGGAWSTLGVLMRRAGRLGAAVVCHRRGLEHVRDYAAIWSNLGNVLTDLGRWDEAVAAHERAVALTPDQTSAAFNLVIALRKSCRFAAALPVLERACRIDPANPSLRWEQALTWLQVGAYEQGLPAYEVRRHIAAYRNRIPDGTPWDGSPLAGRTLLLSTEQGFGDALLMARYIPLVRRLAEGGGRVILESHPELDRALAGLAPDMVVPVGAPLPAYDVHASLMSLPALLGTRIDTVPPPVPITVPEVARAKAARLVGPPDDTLKVGIVWSGRVTFADNARRAATLDRFLPFAEVPGVRLFSLQKGPPEAQLAELGTSALVVPIGPHMEDFADTAAVIERLDLVIMTDSSVAHLAGSLGRPVWNLVQYAPYWIYGFEGNRTPWYPSMRLFRQGADEDWTPVFHAARRVLEQLAAERRAARVPALAL